MSELEIKVIDQDFSICKPENLSQIKFEDDYIFIGKTDEEHITQITYLQKKKTLRTHCGSLVIMDI